MTNFSTPGQKRKRNIKIFLVLSVIAIITASWYIEGPSQRFAKAAIADPEKIIIEAEVVDLYQEEERYRTFKGKRRTRINSFVTLTYDFNGERVTETKKVSEPHFESLEQGGQIELWATGPKHNLVLFKRTILADANTSPISRSIQAATVSGVGAFVLSIILIPVFGREPDGYMPEGFYSGSSWLDVEDHQLIAIDDDKLVRFKFAKSCTKKVQKAYQGDLPLGEILSIRGKGNKLDAIALDSIIKVSTRHYEDTYEISYQEADKKTGELESKTMDLEFLNPTVKTHAMEALVQQLPDSKEFEKRINHYSRLQSASSSGIGLTLGLVGVWYFDNSLGLALCGLLALYMMKNVIARLWSPTILTEYLQPETQNVEKNAKTASV